MFFFLSERRLGWKASDRDQGFSLGWAMRLYQPAHTHSALIASRLPIQLNWFPPRTWNSCRTASCWIRSRALTRRWWGRRRLGRARWGNYSERGLLATSSQLRVLRATMLYNYSSFPGSGNECCDCCIPVCDIYDTQCYLCNCYVCFYVAQLGWDRG